MHADGLGAVLSYRPGRVAAGKGRLRRARETETSRKKSNLPLYGHICSDAIRRGRRIVRCEV